MQSYNGKKIMIGLSAGINSASVLFWLYEQGYVPSELHLYYSHLYEHSEDSFRFVKELIRWAKKHFKNVKVRITRKSVLNYFYGEKMIPHPSVSPCTNILKIIPMEAYAFDNGVEIDLIGYVRKEKRRINNMGKKRIPSLFLEKDFPIKLFDDNWCFEIVEKHLGWYPKIYTHYWDDSGFVEYIKNHLHRLDIDSQKSILKKVGKHIRVFKHNNCLPCKNMTIEELFCVEYFYPDKMKSANELSSKLKSHWGRSSDEYYTTFGKQDFEPKQCDICAFD